MSDQQIPNVKINIDGQELDVPQGCMIIEAADNAGIRIPRFCYHKKLSVAANCRMCLVDVDGARRPAPACATPVTAGMKVLTKSPKALEFQKSVMEFLLINHPLDCPICDQGGECELQDNAMGYGKDVSRYNEGKRVVKDKDIGPLIATDLTRCIHCTRCVRFGVEIAGMQELGMSGRGEKSMIATFLGHSVDSEMSGNVIDLCPVGALTSKPFRYKARAWELQQTPSIAAHDCVGSNLYVHVRRGEAMRVVPRENEGLNEVWLSDRDRYSYEGIQAADRALQPMIKKNGNWQTVEWSEALEYAANALKHAKQHHGGQSIAALANSSCTTEEYVLLQKIFRALGSHNMDHRLWQNDFTHEEWQGHFPGMEMQLADIEAADTIFYVGGNVRKEQPIVHHRMRKAFVQNGAKIMWVNPTDFGFAFTPAVSAIVNGDDMVLELAAIVKHVLDAGSNQKLKAELSSLLQGLPVGDKAKAIAENLLSSKKAVLLLGEIAVNHSQASLLYALMQVLKQVLPAQFGQLTSGANTAGAWLSGIIPHRGVSGEALNMKGLNAKQMLNAKSGIATYLLLNVEPDLDTAYGKQAIDALQQAEAVIALTPYVTDSIKTCATVILPIASFAETSGTYINAMGQWQSFTAVAKGLGESRPGWKVLRVLANFLGLFGFDYASSEEVLNELRRSARAMPANTSRYELPEALPSAQRELKAVGYIPLYAADNLVRRSPALQATVDAQRQHCVQVPKSMAERLQLVDGGKAKVQQGEASAVYPIQISDSLAELTVLLPMGVEASAELSAAFAPVSIASVKE